MRLTPKQMREVRDATLRAVRKGLRGRAVTVYVIDAMRAKYDHDQCFVDIVELSIELMKVLLPTLITLVEGTK